jgi:iron complex transport system ATP-binding protein
MTIAAHKLSITLQQKLVVDSVDLCFVNGRITAVLGPNGAGKTSLVKALAGLISPTSGRVTLDGGPLPLLAERARRIGYLPQNCAPAWNITVRELVALGRLPHRARLSAETQNDVTHIQEAMLATHTEQLADRTIDSLSGGERARAAMARVLAGQPEWIIADEPFASLDPPHQRDLASVFARVARSGTGIIVVLHQLNTAFQLADDVVLLANGAVVAAGDVASCLNPKNLKITFGIDFEVIEQNELRAILPGKALP